MCEQETDDVSDFIPCVIYPVLLNGGLKTEFENFFNEV